MPSPTLSAKFYAALPEKSDADLAEAIARMGRIHRGAYPPSVVKKFRAMTAAYRAEQARRAT